MSIAVEPYNTDWPSKYKHIIEELSPLLQNIPTIDFTHVGSTAVPTLCSRPITDILVTVHPSDLNDTQRTIISAGYNTSLHIPSTLGIVFEAAALHTHAHILYLCPRPSLAARVHIALRDLLASDADLRSEYAVLKTSCAAVPPPPPPYPTSKSEFLQQTLILSPQILPSDLPLLFASPSSPSHPHRWSPLRTPRLELREFELHDVEGMYHLESEPANARFQSWEPWTRSEARRNVVRGIWRGYGPEREVVELAVVREGEFVGRIGGRVVGGCGCGGGEDQEEEKRERVQKESGTKEKKEKEDEEESGPSPPIHIDLWYSFLPRVQGAGLATEALHAFIAALMEREKRVRGSKAKLELEIECDPRNTPSWRLARRLGFEQHSLTERAWECKGEWVDSLVYRRVV
ncbi:acetyltransferase [Stagonosporopsis vannaccii]|nr:acetyltransferase [Stagonosporopsis vannaccii]